MVLDQRSDDSDGESDHHRNGGRRNYGHDEGDLLNPHYGDGDSSGSDDGPNMRDHHLNPGDGNYDPGIHDRLTQIVYDGEVEEQEKAAGRVESGP